MHLSVSWMKEKKKLGFRNARCVSRVYGDPLDLSPPKRLPSWMITSDNHAQPESDESSAVRSFRPAVSTPTSSNDALYGPMYTFDLDHSSVSDTEDFSLYFYFKRHVLIANYC